MGRVLWENGVMREELVERTLGNARLTFDELMMVVVEVEGTLNSRPLMYDYDKGSEEVLTPSHLIYGRRIKSLPDKNTEDEPENESNCSKRFRHLTLRLLHFWNRWRKQYLTDLRELHRVKAGEKQKKCITSKRKNEIE